MRYIIAICGYIVSSISIGYGQKVGLNTLNPLAKLHITHDTIITLLKISYASTSLPIMSVNKTRYVSINKGYTTTSNLYVNGSIQFSQQLKPNYDPGNPNYMLSSQGPSMAPKWKPPLKAHIIHKRVLIPQWLRDSIIFHVTPSYNVALDRLEFYNPTYFTRYFRYTLFDSGQVDTNNIYIIKVLYGRSQQLTPDNDIYIGIADDSTIIGAGLMDGGNHGETDFVFGNSGNNLTSFTWGEADGGLLGGSPYLLFIIFKIKGTKVWISSYDLLPNNKGIAAQTSPRTINATKGLWLEVYGHDPGERHTLDFIELTIIEIPQL